MVVPRGRGLIFKSVSWPFLFFMSSDCNNNNEFGLLLYRGVIAIKHINLFFILKWGAVRFLAIMICFQRMGGAAFGAASNIPDFWSFWFLLGVFLCYTRIRVSISSKMVVPRGRGLIFKSVWLPFCFFMKSSSSARIGSKFKCTPMTDTQSYYTVYSVRHSA